MSAAPRFFLSPDNDGHWFVVPLERSDEWDAWKAIPSDDQRAWTPPEFAQAVGGSPSLINFTDPIYD